MNLKDFFGYKSNNDIKQEARQQVWYEQRHERVLQNAVMENEKYLTILTVAATATAGVWAWILLGK